MSTSVISKDGHKILKAKIVSLANWALPIISNSKILFGVGVLWILFQIVFVNIYKYTDLVGDQGYYVYYAQKCVEHGTMFPDISNLYGEFIYSPGWINIIILWIKLFGSVETLPYFSIFLNVFILILLWRVALRINGSRNMANIVAYLFMLFPSNSSIVLHALSEIPFEFFSLASFYLVFSRRYWAIMVAGVSIALAQWIRPLAVAWMIAAIFFMIYQEKRYRHVVVYSLSIVATLAIIGYASTMNFPRPVFQAQTGGVNFLMGANDMATGLYCGESRRDPKGLGYLPGLRDSTKLLPVKENSQYVYAYTSKYTYYEADSIFKARAIDWVLGNPVKWLSLIPAKTYYLLWSVPRFFFTFNDKADTLPFKLCQLYGRTISLVMAYHYFVRLCWTCYAFLEMHEICILRHTNSGMFSNDGCDMLRDAL